MVARKLDAEVAEWIKHVSRWYPDLSNRQVNGEVENNLKKQKQNHQIKLPLDSFSVRQTTVITHLFMWLQTTVTRDAIAQHISTNLETSKISCNIIF
jgi:hypothetical protein